MGEAGKLGGFKGEVTGASRNACHAKLGLLLQFPMGPFSSKGKLFGEHHVSLMIPAQKSSQQKWASPESWRSLDMASVSSALLSSSPSSSRLITAVPSPLASKRVLYPTVGRSVIWPLWVRCGSFEFIFIHSPISLRPHCLFLLLPLR